jgi:hypothetical protein
MEPGGVRLVPDSAIDWWSRRVSRVNLAILETASSNGAVTKNVAQSRPAARNAGQWEVLAKGDASRDLVKDARVLDAEIHER